MEIGKVNREIVAVNYRVANCPYRQISWEDVKSLKDKALICEDIIRCDKKQFEILNTATG